MAVIHNPNHATMCKVMFTKNITFKYQHRHIWSGPGTYQQTSYIKNREEAPTIPTVLWFVPVHWSTSVTHTKASLLLSSDIYFWKLAKILQDPFHFSLNSECFKFVIAFPVYTKNLTINSLFLSYWKVLIIFKTSTTERNLIKVNYAINLRSILKHSSECITDTAVSREREEPKISLLH